MSDVTTTAGETFSHRDSVILAQLIYRRFGRDVAVAAAAWRRLLGNSCPDRMFAEMIEQA